MLDQDRRSTVAVKAAQKELRALALNDDATADQLAEATTKLHDLETRAEALDASEEVVEVVKVEPTEDAEARELRSLEGKCELGLGRIVAATVEHRAVDGAELELQQHHGLGLNQAPLSMIREVRAVTSAPTDVGTGQASIVPGVFPRSAAEFLSIPSPTVPVGDHAYPVLTKNAVVEALAEAGGGTETDGSFSGDLLAPSRLQASFRFSREDRARFAGMNEALRMNLADALSDALDKQIMQGTEGLLTGTNLPNNNVSAITAFAGYRSNLLFGRVDGTFAGSVADIRVVLGQATYGHAGTQYRGNAGDVSALESIMRTSGGVRVSAHVPGVSGNKQNAVVRLGMRADAVAPTWEGVTIIPDEVTKAADGEIVLTAVMLYAFKILRKGGFYKQQSQHA